jgi:hypothetical protein
MSKKVKMTRRVALYARQDALPHACASPFSLQEQFAAMRGVAEELGRTVVDEYRDDGPIAGELSGLRALQAGITNKHCDEVYISWSLAAPAPMTRDELVFYLLLPLIAREVEVFVYDTPPWAGSGPESEYLVHALAPILEVAHDAAWASIKERQLSGGHRAHGVTPPCSIAAQRD